GRFRVSLRAATASGAINGAPPSLNAPRGRRSETSICERFETVIYDLDIGSARYKVLLSRESKRPSDCVSRSPIDCHRCAGGCPNWRRGSYRGGWGSAG